MNYKLAKQLKDAGFISNGQAWNETLKEILPVPTLEELIKECGEEFDELEKRGGVFFASGSSKNDIGMKLLPFLSGGLTPKEAVAKLYLAINKS